MPYVTSVTLMVMLHGSCYGNRFTVAHKVWQQSPAWADGWIGGAAGAQPLRCVWHIHMLYTHCKLMCFDSGASDL
jgi:hypothetical protein